MRKFRILILALSVAVFGVFLFTRIREHLTSDFTAPVITAQEDSLYVSVDATEEDLLAGMYAQDNLDGDVTDTLVVVSKTKFISDATLRVNYAAFDKNNNVGAYSRTITYTDYYSPHFAMSQPLRFLGANSSNDYLKNISAFDCLDGNLTRQIKITFGETDGVSDTVSQQKVNLLVTNSAGDNSSLELIATFEDYTTYSIPSPALKSYILYTPKGQRPDYRANLSGVWSSGTVRKFADTDYTAENDIRVSDAGVNYNSPGVYTVTYWLSGRRDARTGEIVNGKAILYVVVEE